ncbi:hypothetical protein BC941DRAFT_419728 [Chlamydoabsidia padenii]|nr:hypothetical protein BC941DRAFT_419728 [Chlamydoabsidia padenii]
MNSLAPVNAGHTFANAAEGYEDKEAWTDAIEAHQHAAEQFQKALDYTQDAEAGKSLRLLVANHTRRSKDLERKLNKIKLEEGSTVPTPVDEETDKIKMDELLQVLPETSLSHGRKGYAGIGESYALLSTDNYDEEDDASDPFNKFLKVVETLVDQLSNPVAFASAPLNEDDIPTPYQHTTEDMDTSSVMMESFFLVPDHHDTTNDSVDVLQTENEQLKQRIEQLSRRIQSLEKTAEESNMLKSSILQFRHDVQRQAKRIMQNQDTSSSMRSSSVALLANSGIHGSHNSYPRHPALNQPNGGSTAELVTRLKETEDENRRLKDQIDKQQLLMNKYRERWEKLKESAKKRRAQPDPTNDHLPQRPYSSRPPALLRSLAQQSTSTHPPPSLAKSNRIVSDNP